MTIFCYVLAIRLNVCSHRKYRTGWNTQAITAIGTTVTTAATKPCKKNVIYLQTVFGVSVCLYACVLLRFFSIRWHHTQKGKPDVCRLGLLFFYLCSCDARVSVCVVFFSNEQVCLPSCLPACSDWGGVCVCLFACTLLKFYTFCKQQQPRVVNIACCSRYYSTYIMPLHCSARWLCGNAVNMCVLSVCLLCICLLVWYAHQPRLVAFILRFFNSHSLSVNEI